jgi:hypothetical protein
VSSQDVSILSELLLVLKIIGQEWSHLNVVNVKKIICFDVTSVGFEASGSSGSGFEVFRYLA